MSKMVNDFRLNRSGVVILLAVGIFVMVFLVYAGRGRYVEETIKISELLSASIHLAEAGGAMVVHIRKMDDSEISQLTKGLTIKEGANEYATIGNRKSLEIITSGLKAAWPRLNYKSKEIEREVIKGVTPSVGNVEVLGLANRDEAVPLDKVTVWIDPLDAGQEYIDGATDAELLKYTAVMVCIAVEGESIAGVIHLPFLTDVKTGQTGVTKWAWVHHGVSHTLQRDISSKSKDGNTVRVIASRSHPGDVFSVAESSFKDYKSMEKIVAAGAGYKALEVSPKGGRGEEGRETDRQTAREREVGEKKEEEREKTREN